MKKAVSQTLKQSVILLVVLGVAASLYFITLKKQAPKIVKFMEPGTFESVTQVKISLYGTNASVMELVRTNGSWAMTSPVPDSIEPESIELLASALEGLSIENSITNPSREKLAEYGIDPASGARVELFRKGKIFRTLVIGHPTVGGDLSYVQFDPRRVDLVFAYKLKQLLASSGEYRNRVLMEVPIQDLVRAEWQGPNGKVTVSFDAATQSFKDESTGKPLDAFSVKPRLMDFYSLTASDFIPKTPNAAMLRIFGLALPKYRLCLISANATNTLLIGETNTNGAYYGFHMERRAVVLIEDPEIPAKFRPITPGRPHGN